MCIRDSYLGFDSSEFAVRKHGTRRNLNYAHFGNFAQLRPCLLYTSRCV